jgi:hypothetical protein
MRRFAVLLGFLASAAVQTLQADTAVVFNEIMYHPATNEPALEWVEFHNQLAVDVDISEWSVRGGIDFTFPSNTIVRGGGFLLLASSPATLMSTTGRTNVLGPFTGRLSNDGELLELRNNSDRLVDSVEYGVDGEWPVPADGAGVSLAKRDRDLGSAAAENWTISEQIGGTPGAENAIPVLLTQKFGFNEVAGATNASFWVEIVNLWETNHSLANYIIARDGAGNEQFVFPAGTTLRPAEALTLTNSTLGFQPLAGDRLFLFAPGRTQVVAGVVVQARSKGRHPDGLGRWLPNPTPTPGRFNAFPFHNGIVINEIMYQPRIVPATTTENAKESPEGWIELYNRSAAAIDLSGWELAGGITYRFSPGQVIPAGGYLVVADDAEYLRVLHPGIPIVGDFGGRLSGRSDLIVLRDPAGLPADEVRYYDGGNWPIEANGGGSSLELMNPGADNARGEAWAASDESQKMGWQTFTYRTVASVPNGNGQPTRWNDFILGLLSEGDCLVDDIRVIESPSSTALPVISNGDFETGLTGWRLLGTHNKSSVIVDPADSNNHVLHLVATGAQEHMHNHIERTYNAGRTVVNGREYEISFRARWLSGNNLLNTRLYFNRAPRSTPLPTPALSGTPGRQNSRFKLTVGPTFSQLEHFPIVPKVGEQVTVWVTADHPTGVSSNQLWYAVNSGAWRVLPMSYQGGNLYSGTIPGQATNSVVQFYVKGYSTQGDSAMFPARGPASGALFTTEDGQANLPLAHNFRIILNSSNTAVLHALTNVMSNDLLPCTVIYDERRAYYDCGVHLRGSERGRYSDTRTGFHINFPPDDPFRGVHPVMLIDRSGAGDATQNRQEEIVLKHIMNRAGGLPGTYSEICRVIAPRRAHTGPAQFFPRHEDVFIETAYPNGGDGRMFEMELIYYPTSTNINGYKNPQPDEVIGTDLTNLGNDKEFYRYNFMIKNHRDADDYSGLMALGKAWSLSGAALDAQSRQIMDIDQWMRAYALVSLCSVGDMYTFGNNHNFFTYQRPDGKFVYFPWDMDFAFTRGANGALVGDQNLAKVVNLPGNLRRMYAHMLDIITVSFNTNYMAYWTAHYAKFGPGQNYAGSLSTINGRANFVRNTINTAGGTTPFEITGTNVIQISSNLLILNGTAPIAVQSIKVNGKEYPITWSNLRTWRMTVPIHEAASILNVVGHDLRGNVLTNFSRTVTVNYSGSQPDPTGAIVINEIMYNPAAPDSAYVELSNKSNFSFDLSGWRLNGIDFIFPPGSVITNGQYLTIAKSIVGFNLAYGVNVPIPLGQFNGTLQNDGETITLLRPGSTPGSEIVVNQVRYENSAPWPVRADGTGPSLQLIDATQDNSRVINWSDAADWRLFTLTAAGDNAATLQLFLAAAGELLIDDVSLVEGDVAATGANLLANAGFELSDLGLWRATGNHSNSVMITGRSHSGTNSMRLVSTAAGSSSASLSQPLTAPLDPAKTYTFSFWYLPSDKGTGFQFILSPSFRTASAINYRLTTPGTSNSIAEGLPVFPALWLNELLAENLSGIADSRGEREPWIELYNAGTTPINLSGFYLANNYSNLTQWAFPNGASIQPGEFKIIIADNEPSESTATEWHTNFRLAPGTGAVALVWSLSGGPRVLDYLNYGPLLADRSYGAFPDSQAIERQVFSRITPAARNDNTAPPLRVMINEWMAANTRTLLNTNHNNRFDDWFELYNPSETPADLAGYFLTDNLENKTQFSIPAGYTVPARGFLLVWADGDATLNNPNDPALHANFRLERNGDSIGLFASGGALIDSVMFEPQFDDVSQGRYADGTASIYFLSTPTPRGPNTAWANRAPVINPINDAFIAADEPLRFTATATDPDIPLQNLTFSLDGLAPAGASIDPATGLFTWTPTTAQAAGTHTIIIQVRDNGNPPLTGSTTFKASGGIRIAGVTRAANGEVSINFGAISGKRYRVDFKNNLNEAAWTLGTEVTANSSTLTLNDNPGAQPQRFYRITQVD